MSRPGRAPTPISNGPIAKQYSCIALQWSRILEPGPALWQTRACSRDLLLQKGIEETPRTRTRRNHLRDQRRRQREGDEGEAEHERTCKWNGRGFLGKIHRGLYSQKEHPALHVKDQALLQCYIWKCCRGYMIWASSNGGSVLGNCLGNLQRMRQKWWINSLSKGHTDSITPRTPWGDRTLDLAMLGSLSRVTATLASHP